MHPAVRLLLHLRLPFQLILAPVFLLGYAVAEGRPCLPLALVFLALHVGVYGGVTAYNTYYDQDTGPIGSLKHPPRAGRSEMWGGLLLQLAGVAGMAWWDGRVGAVGAAIVVMSTLYSHPRWRLKARPWGSLCLIAVGQGLLPFLAGVWAAGPAGRVAGAALGAGAAAAVAVVAGLYPLTQVYQIEEDARRGDVTFAVRYGAAGAFRAARLGMSAGALAFVLLVLVGQRFAAAWAVGAPVGLAAYLWALSAWQRRFAAQTVYQNHDWALGLSAAYSLAFWGIVLVEIAR